MVAVGTTIADRPPRGSAGWYAYCFFNQVAGGITCYSDSGSTMSDPNAYSGFGSGKNNPAWVTWNEIGPTPEGDYWIGPPRNGPLGKPMFDLTPVNDPFMHIPGQPWRDLMRIHSENGAHPGMSSKGCIVTSKEFRVWLAQEGGGVATVYNPNHNLTPLDKYLNNPLSAPLP